MELGMNHREGELHYGESYMCQRHQGQTLRNKIKYLNLVGSPFGDKPPFQGESKISLHIKVMPLDISLHLEAKVR